MNIESESGRLRRKSSEEVNRLIQTISKFLKKPNSATKLEKIWERSDVPETLLSELSYFETLPGDTHTLEWIVNTYLLSTDIEALEETTRTRIHDLFRKVETVNKLQVTIEEIESLLPPIKKPAGSSMDVVWENGNDLLLQNLRLLKHTRCDKETMEYILQRLLSEIKDLDSEHIPYLTTELTMLKRTMHSKKQRTLSFPPIEDHDDDIEKPAIFRNKPLYVLKSNDAYIEVFSSFEIALMLLKELNARYEFDLDEDAFGAFHAGSKITCTNPAVTFSFQQNRGIEIRIDEQIDQTSFLSTIETTLKNIPRT